MTMTMTAATRQTASKTLAARVAEWLRDPFGIASGYRAYAIYSTLEAKSDDELAAMGLKRTDLPRVAAKALY